MPVTITRAQLAVELRLAPTSTTTLTVDESFTVDRLLGATTAQVELYAPDAPDDVLNECVVRLAGWMHDSPPGRAHADGMGLSGAKALLAPYHQRLSVATDGVVEC